MSVGVIIVAYKNAALAPQLTRTVLGLREVSRVDVVECASPEQPATVRQLSALGDPRLHVHPLEDNVGFGAAVNFAASLSDQEHLLILNPDVNIGSEMLDRLLAHLERNPRVAAVGPHTRWIDGVPQGRLPTRLWNATADLVPTAVASAMGAQKWQACQGSPVAWLEGSIVLLRRRVFLALGGFDDRYFLYSEDEDLFRRFWMNGFGVHQIDGGPEVSHLRGASSADAPLDTRAYYFDSLVLFLERWYGPRASACFRFAFRCATAVRRTLQKEPLASRAPTFRVRL